jgi:hypothetical protein
MPPKSATPKKDDPTSPPADPVAKAGNYKSIAAQYAKAKAIKEREGAEARKKLGGVGVVNGQARGKDRALTDEERVNKRQEAVFKRAWNWNVGFFVWLL